MLAVAILAAGCSGGRPMGLRTDTSSPTDSAVDAERTEPGLGRDINIVQAYGAEHPEEYAGIRFHAGRRSEHVVVGFTADVDRHREAILARVEHPELVEVELARLSKQTQERILKKLTSWEGVHNISVDHDHAEASVAATRVDLAQQLVAAYGDKIRVDVGNLPFPDPGDVDRCPAIPSAEGEPALSVRVDAPTTRVRSGETIGGTVVVTTRGGPLQIGTSESLYGYLLDANGRVVAAPYGARLLSQRVTKVAPHGDGRVPFYATTDPCRSGLGWTLPPGDYSLVIAVEWSEYRMHEPPVGANRVQLTAPMTVTVTK